MSTARSSSFARQIMLRVGRWAALSLGVSRERLLVVRRRPSTWAWLLVCAALVSSCRKPYEPPPTKDIARDPSELVQQLAKAYGQRDLGLFNSLFSTEPTARYIYYLNEPLPGGDHRWEWGEEQRIHQRMFRPQDTPPSDRPVPAELWLASVSITLTPRSAFVEMIYPPKDLDLIRWAPMIADCDASILFDTVGEIDYRVEGRASFIVIEDRSVPGGHEGKFFFYRWEDLGSGITSFASNPDWSDIKSLYR